MKMLSSRFSIVLLNFLAAFDSIAGIPKNVIVMISDGCGYNHFEATSLYQAGQAGIQLYEQFPVQYGMSTYSIDGHTYNPDSARHGMAQPMPYQFADPIYCQRRRQ